jgi:hypothetical protein
MPASQRQQCANYFTMILMARTRVCLDYLAIAEKRYGIYQPKSWSKKDLVVDMETFANMLQQLKYVFCVL